MNATKIFSRTSKRTWARANKLAELAGIKPNAARSFLTTCSDEQKVLLDNGTDLRNKALRSLVDEAAAAAPTGFDSVPKSHRSSCWEITNTESGATYVAEMGECSKMPEVSLDLLYDLKHLISKYSEEEITQGLEVLAFLKS